MVNTSLIFAKVEINERLDTVSFIEIRHNHPETQSISSRENYNRKEMFIFICRKQQKSHPSESSHLGSLSEGWLNMSAYETDISPQNVYGFVRSA